MLEIQEDKSIEKLDLQSQETNAGWQKYNKRLNNLPDDAQIKDCTGKTAEKSKDKKTPN